MPGRSHARRAKHAGMTAGHVHNGETIMRYTIFGESHGPCIGVVLEGVPAGLGLDPDFIAREMARRAPGRSAVSTARKEADAVEIVSGVFNGKATGSPLCALIRNTDARPRSYEAIKDLARPGHADYAAFMRYGGFNDHRGGGHFSGRLTAPLVFAGAVAKLALQGKGMAIHAHVRAIGGIHDVPADAADPDIEALAAAGGREVPALSEERGAAMKQAILTAKAEGDSLGGIVECFVLGLPAGAGGPDIAETAEGIFARHLFAVPAVKGVEFGSGFGLAAMRGSLANDEPYMAEGGTVKTRTNHNGGINGGITNGMPLVFSAAIKPTPSIGRKQRTIDMRTGEPAGIVIEGRHDPCIVPRAVPVIEAAAALAVTELLAMQPDRGDPHLPGCAETCLQSRG